jgi:hypothetical protein
MIRTVSFFLIAAAVAVTGCKSSRRSSEATAQPAAETTASAQPSEQSWKPVRVNPAYQWPGKTDAFDLGEVTVSGDTLLVTVSYSGGCRDHIFTLHSNGAYMKSLPPQMMLWLEHLSNGDNCRAMITETLKFDLRQIRYSGVNQVVLILNEDRERRTTYVY